jgi:recombination protein RecA
MSSGREALAESLDKLIGSGRDIEEALNYLDTGYPPLNEALSGRYDGGFPAGKMLEISGGSSTGKTALATKLMVEAQKAGGYAIFCDWEVSFSTELAVQFGLNPARTHFAYFKPETWEEGNANILKIAQMIRQNKIIEPGAPIVAVADSIAAAVPRSMLYDSEGKRRPIDQFTMNDTSALSRVTSTTLKVIKPLIDEYAVTMVYLNQVRTKIGVSFGDPTTTPGGSAMEFYADARLRLTRAQIKEKGSNEFLGQQINVRAIKSKFTAPFKSCSLRLMFDGEAARFDTTTSLIEELAEMKLIPKDGNQFTWPDGTKRYLKALAEKVDKDGLYPELVKLLPATE